MDDPNPVTCEHTEGGKLNLRRCTVCGLVRIGDVWCDPGELTASRERLEALEGEVEELRSENAGLRSIVEGVINDG